MNAQGLLAVPTFVVSDRPVPQRGEVAAGRVPKLTWVLCAALLLCGCILVSAATTTDADWWHLYFSRLGMMGDFSSFAFNGGLIASGAIIACSAWMLRVRLTDVMPHLVRGRIAMRVMPPAIAGLGISLLAIGAYPLSVDPAAHERATNGAVLSFAFLLLSHRLLLWQLAPALRRASITSAVVMVVSLVALKTEVISLTIFEAIAFAVILWWVHLLEQIAHRHASRMSTASESGVAAAPVAAGRISVRRNHSDHDRAAALALATTMPRRDDGKPSSMSRSSSAPTSAPNASAPGSSMMPDASDPAITGSKPRSSTRAETISRSAAESPAIAIALRPRSPEGRASSSRSWYPMCPSAFTTRAPARCR